MFSNANFRWMPDFDIYVNFYARVMCQGPPSPSFPPPLQDTLINQQPWTVLGLVDPTLAAMNVLFSCITRQVIIEKNIYTAYLNTSQSFVSYHIFSRLSWKAHAHAPRFTCPGKHGLSSTPTCILATYPQSIETPDRILKFTSISLK